MIEQLNSMPTQGVTRSSVNAKQVAALQGKVEDVVKRMEKLEEAPKL